MVTNKYKLSVLLATSIIILATLQIRIVEAAGAINCPTIECDANIGDNVCYLHSGTNPVSYIKLYQCPTG